MKETKSVKRKELDSMTNVPKKGALVKGFFDFVILCLLLAAAGFGGYFWGLHERLAPVANVAPGTPNAIEAAMASITPAPATTPNKISDAKTAQPSAPPISAKKKYWLASSGVDYIGYSITVKVNDETVDAFFGPGKSIDITRFVKSGDNSVVFEAKALGEGYNKHPNDAQSQLVVKLISGPTIQESYKPSDVVCSYTRNAAESTDFADTKHFKAN